MALPPRLKTRALIALAGALAFLPGAAAATIQAARVTLDSVKVPSAGPIVRAELTSEEMAQSQAATIALNLRNRAELEARVQKGEILSPSEMSARYYPTLGTWSAVANWALSQGLSVEPEGTSHMSVVVHGQVAQVASAFQARFARVRGGDGREYISAVSAPSVPSEIAASIAGVLRLQPQFHPRTAATVYSPVVTGGGYPPQYLLDQYGATGVGDGTGQIIAIYGFNSPPNPTDLTTYWSKIGSTHTMADVTIINPGNYPTFNDQFASITTTPGAEVTLDTEIVSGLCPGAKIRIYCTGDYASAAQAVLEDLGQYPQMHQLVFASAEPEATAPTADSIYFLALSAQGVTTFAPSGDGGSNPDPAKNYEGYNPASPLTVMYPASDPYVTAVGGTYQVYTGEYPIAPIVPFTGIEAELAWANGTFYSWMYNGVLWDGGGSGGGLSTVFARPYWQGGPGLPSGNARAVPDVAAVAMAKSAGFYIYMNQDVWASGTSESAAVWTALCAILNQSLQASGLSPIGLLGPKIYPLAGSPAMTYLTQGWITYLYAVDPNTYGPDPQPPYPGQFSFFPPLPGTYVDLQALIAGLPPPMYPPPYPRDTNGAYFTLPTYDLITGLGIPNIAQLAATLEATGGMTVAIPTPLPSAPVMNGSAPITVTASATGSPTSYQWYLQDNAIPGATGASLVITPNAANKGTYTVIASNSTGSVSALAGVLSITTDAWIVNLSARGETNSILAPLIAGFVTTGTGNKSLLIRGDGPALAGFGITDFLPDPQLTLFNSAGTEFGSTETWSTSLDSTFTQVGAFALTPGSHDTALLESLAPGANTAQIMAQASGYGIVLAEIYDADNGAPTNRLINISARAYVSEGDGILIAGFVIAGSTPQTVVIRGDGPGLNAVTNGAVSPYLVNPRVTLFNSSGEVIASNTGWGNVPVPGSAVGTIEIQPLTDFISARVGAFPLAKGSADSAIVATLPPGTYTAQVAPDSPTYKSFPYGPSLPGSVNTAEGNVLVEIYELR